MTIRSIAVAALAIVAVACNEKKKTAQVTTITMGVVIDQTGSIATPSWGRAIELAVQDANAGLQRAGRNDLRFALATANSTNTPEVARAAALDLVHNRGIKAVITDSSQDQIGLLALAYDGDPSHDMQVPVMCIACTSPGIGNPQATDADPIREQALRNAKGWGFRTTVSDAYQTRVVARAIADAGDVNKDGKLRVAVYASDEAYGKGFTDAIRRDMAIVQPAAVVEAVTHPMQMNIAEYGWNEDIAKLTGKGKKGMEPDAVVVVTFPKFAAAFTRAYLAAGAKPRLVQTHNFRSVRVLEPMGDKAEGQEGTSQAVLSMTASGQAFDARLRAATGAGAAFRDSAAYDAATTLMLAALKATQGLADPAHVTGAAVRDALRKISEKGGDKVGVGPEEFAKAATAIAAGRGIDYDGASGPCDFDQNGNIVADVARYRVEHGAFVDSTRYACTQDPACLAAPHMAEARP